jgi:intracellular septation protein A
MRTLLTDMAAGLLFFAVLALTDDIYKATLVGVIFGLCVTGCTNPRCTSPASAS